MDPLLLALASLLAVTLLSLCFFIEQRLSLRRARLRVLMAMPAGAQPLGGGAVASVGGKPTPTAQPWVELVG